MDIKKVLALFSFVTFPLYGTYYTNIALSEVSPELIQIGWDLHHVIFQPKNSARFLKGLRHIGPLSKLRFSRSKKFKELRKELGDIRKSGATAEVYQQLLEKYGEKKLASILQEFALQLKPTKGIEALICELASLGYEQHVASNIGPTFLTKLQNKFRHIFAHIKDGVTGTYKSGQQLVRKPDATFYTQYTDQYNPDKNQIIIFIDDKLENVKAAQRAGWIGIHFTTTKELRKDLRALGIWVKK